MNEDSRITGRWMMDASNNIFSEVVSLLKSWIPWRPEPANVSRDFWMPGHSCRVCYDCDAQFTLFNRRHHCRLCGRVFCAKCTANSVPAPSYDPMIPLEEQEVVRLCDYCFKQWKYGLITDDGRVWVPNQDLCSSMLPASFTRTRSGGLRSVPRRAGRYQHLHPWSIRGPRSAMRKGMRRHSLKIPRFGKDLFMDAEYPSSSQYEFSWNSVGIDGEDDDYNLYVSDLSEDNGYYTPLSFDELSYNEGSHKFHPEGENVDSKSSERILTRKVWIDDEGDEYRLYSSDSETLHYSDDDGYYTPTDFDDISNDDDDDDDDGDEEPQNVHPVGENIDSKSLSSSPVNQVPSSSEGISQFVKKDERYGDECEASPSSYPAEPVDFENDGLLWLPPEPEDEDDEREADLFDDEDDTDGAGDWGYWHKTSSFGSGESRSRDKPTDEQKKVTKYIVDGHFRALISQLLQVENLPVVDENCKDSWLEIITALSWEAASLLKPYTTKGGEMDPGGYVKVKCIASGHRSESMVVKGVVCKKNVSHRRMTSKLEKPRLMILGGALEYQRISNLLSSFDTLLLQEMDHLKMAVAKIHAHKPNILLVEKSVSRFAQEYLLEKNISLVLNIKRPLLERIARCTGAQIIPSIDHLFSQKLGYCEKFHVERFREDFGSAGQGGKKLAKTLMYFEGCPKPLGCTILLRGANGDELKKVKHVVQYGIFAAYHLALETSFLADEGASLPEFPNSPMAVAHPDKPSTIARSISTVPTFTTANVKSQGPQHCSGPQRANSVPSAIGGRNIQKIEETPASFLSKGTSLWSLQPTLKESSVLVSTSEKTSDVFFKKSEMGTKESSIREIVVDKNKLSFMNTGVPPSESSARMNSETNSSAVALQPGGSEVTSVQQDGKNHNNQSEVSKPLQEVFPSAASDNQSILVSLSSRSVRKGTVCERCHLFRIKYYGSFDKPLGRFLRDNLFDKSYRCPSCDLPSEAHVHCYTHRQGTLTMSVKKLPDIFLPGEKEGKIWMWHRCLQCPRTNGFPPATFRRVMSDAAWGLSFGKFLELSFSNHAAASRTASCGHSLHRDCLRFYGFGRMVACFRYATIDVHSVYLPPQKLDFYYERPEWIQQETDKVANQAEVLFSEVLKSLNQIAEKQTSSGPPDLRDQIAELEGLLHNEKLEFMESFQKASGREVSKGKHVVDILEINRLRRQLLFQSYMWDQRLVCAAKLENYSPRNCFSSSISVQEEKPVIDIEKLKDMDMLEHGKGSESGDSTVVDAKLNANLSYAVHQEPDLNKNSNCRNEDYSNLSASQSMFNQFDNEKPKANVRRALSEGQFPVIENLSDTLDAAWTGEIQRGPILSKKNSFSLPDIASVDLEDHSEENIVPKIVRSPSSALFSIGSENMEDFVSWLKMPFLNFYRSSSNKNFLGSSSKLDTLTVYDRFNISSFRELELRGGARLLLPVGVNDTVIPVYDDELTSTISYALVSYEYHFQISDDGDRPKDWGDSMASLSFSDSVNFQLFHSIDDITCDPHRSFGSGDDFTGSRSSLIMDPPSSTKSLHARVSFGDDGSDKVKYTVTCYYAKWFETLRRVCCPSELDFIRSLSRCKKWGAQGGKSNVFFAKTLDDRFIIKQVTKTELESFIKLAPKYFQYLSEAIRSRSPTCLAKILGVYQITTKQPKGGKESRIDVLVMENLLFRRNVTRLYDLKGSSRSRYNPDSSGTNKVLLDQNLIESMPTNPIFVGNKAKRLLERAVWNDTAFLASNDLMDYSLSLGVDEEKHELVIGIIDFLRQYTWDKHLETWVKASGILGGPKNASPTVISPEQYKKRFRKAMSTYFLMIPDQWFPPTVPSKSQSDTGQENDQHGTSAK